MYRLMKVEEPRRNMSESFGSLSPASCNERWKTGKKRKGDMERVGVDEQRQSGLGHIFTDKCRK